MNALDTNRTLINFPQMQEDYEKIINQYFKSSTNSAFSSLFLTQSTMTSETVLPKREEKVISFNDSNGFNEENKKNLLHDIGFSPQSYTKEMFNKTNPESISSKTKKPKFCIITERKMKPDAIFKKINKAFYNWIIKYLNFLAKDEFKFIKVSKMLIKTIKKSDVKLILKESLSDLLLKDAGSEKYKKREENKDNVKKILESKSQNEYDALSRFLQKPLYVIYEDFKNVKADIKGPKCYVDFFNHLKKNYLAVFNDKLDY